MWLAKIALPDSTAPASAARAVDVTEIVEEAHRRITDVRRSPNKVSNSSRHVLVVRHSRIAPNAVRTKIVQNEGRIVGKIVVRIE